MFTTNWLLIDGLAVLRLAVLTHYRTPNGIRTRAATLKGWCPRPLDDGGKDLEFVGRALETYQQFRTVPRVTIFPFASQQVSPQTSRLPTIRGFPAEVGHFQRFEAMVIALG